MGGSSNSDYAKSGDACQLIERRVQSADVDLVNRFPSHPDALASMKRVLRVMSTAQLAS